MNQRIINIVGSSLLVLLVAFTVYRLMLPGPKPEGNTNTTRDGTTKDGTTKDGTTKDGTKGTVNNNPPARVAWLDQIASRDLSVRRPALAAIDEHKTEAGKAIPVLLARLDECDPATRSALSEALVYLGKDDSPAEKDGIEAVRAGLVKALEKDDASKTVAILALGKLNIRNDVIVTALQKGLQSEDKTLQRIAALTLRRLLSSGSGSEVGLPEGVDERSFAGRWLRIAHLKWVSSEDTAIVPSLIESLEDPDPSLQIWAAEIFAEYGDTIRTSPDALPALTQRFKGDNQDVALVAGRALGKICLRESTVAGTLLSALGDSKPDVRRRAIEGFSMAVRKVGQKEPYKIVVPMALQTPDAIAALSKALDDEDPVVRVQAISTLGWIGPPAAKSIPSLVKAAGAGDRVQRLAAIAALGNINREPATVVPVLVAGIKDADGEIKVASRLALTRYGKEALPALTKAVRGDDADIRAGAIQALGEIGPEATSALPDLKPLLKDEAIFTRVLAAAAMLQIDRTNKDALPVLKTALAEKDLPARDALDAVKPLGPVAATLTPELAKLLESDDKGVAWRAAEALAAIGPAAVGAAPALAAVIKKCPDTARNKDRIDLDSAEYVTQRAIEALVAIGPDAKAAADALVEVLKKNKDLPAADALSLIDPKRIDGLPTLTESSQSAFDNVREVAMRAMGRLGPTARDAIPALIERLAGEPSLASPVKEALVRLGPVAVPALIQALSDRSQRIHALDVLGRIGTPAREAIPAMLKASEGSEAEAGFLALTYLGDAGVAAIVEGAKDRTRCVSALKALTAMEGRAAPAVKGLIDLLKTKDYPEKAEVLRTLAAIGIAAKSALIEIKDAMTKETSEEIQAAAALALVRCGGDVKTAGPVLLRLFKEAKNRNARRDAARGLGYTPAETKESVPLLLALLKDPAFDLREAAAEALGNLGDDAVKALPAMIEALNTDVEPVVKVTLCKALTKFPGSIKTVLPELQGRLKERGTVSVAAIESLTRLGADAKPALPALRELLMPGDDTGISANDQDTVLARALWKIEGKAALKDVLPLLQRQLNAQTYDRALADTIDALGDLGDSAAELVPQLVPRTDSIHQVVRRASVKALGKIGPSAKSALPWLQRASGQETDEELKRLSKEAISAISKS